MVAQLPQEVVLHVIFFLLFIFTCVFSLRLTNTTGQYY